MKNKGFSLVEVLIGAGIILMATTSVLSAYSLYLRAAVSNTSNIQASLLSEEGIEAVKSIRDGSWTSNIVPLSLNTNYYLAWNSSSSLWTLSTTASSIDNTFFRTVVFSNAYRDSSSNLTASTTFGATIDSGTREITANVSWLDRGATSTRSISTYISNIFNN